MSLKNTHLCPKTKMKLKNRLSFEQKKIKNKKPPSLTNLLQRSLITDIDYTISFNK